MVSEMFMFLFKPSSQSPIFTIRHSKVKTLPVQMDGSSLLLTKVTISHHAQVKHCLVDMEFLVLDHPF
jgi:hypothetical protein